MRLLIKLCLTALILSAGLKANAQRGKFIISSYGAYGYATLMYENLNDYNSTYRAPTGTVEFAGRSSAGLQLGYMFSHRMGIVSGVAYDNSAWKYEAESSRNHNITRQRRMQVPLLFRAEKSDEERGGYYLQAGLITSFLTGIRNDRYGSSINPSREEEFKEVTYAIQINPSAIVTITKPLSVIIGFDFQHQIVNNFSSEAQKGYLMSIGAVLGLCVKL